MMGLYLKRNSKMLIVPERLDASGRTCEQPSFRLNLQYWNGKRPSFYLETLQNFHTLKALFRVTFERLFNRAEGIT